MGRVRVVGEPSAGCESGRDASLGLLGRHADVDVDAAPARLWWMERLERNVRAASVSVDHVLTCPEAPVPEGGGPERTNVAAGILCDGDAQGLHLGGVGLELQRPSRGRDPAGQLDITLA